jgi:hypothetical protein
MNDLTIKKSIPLLPAMARLRPAAALLALVVWGTVAPGAALAQATEPEVTVRVLSPQETEFKIWTQAETAHTVAGYQQYLDMYPNGRYADRVKALMHRLLNPPSKSAANAAPATPAQPAPLSTGLRESPAKLLSGAPRSGAVDQMPGETYIGPGPLTVGHWGARKQLVLPTGAWVLLASVDRTSGHQNSPVPLVSLVFGQYRSGQLVSFMSYLFNGRTQNGARTWGDFDDCHNKPPAQALRVQESSGSAKLCAWTQTLMQTARVEDAGWEAAVASTAQLGAPLPAAPLLFTRATVLDSNGHYLTIRRADFAPSGDASAALQARHSWLKSYVPLMLEGFDKRIAAKELEPERELVQTARIRLPD